MIVPVSFGSGSANVAVRVGVAVFTCAAAAGDTRAGVFDRPSNVVFVPALQHYKAKCSSWCSRPALRRSSNRSVGPMRSIDDRVPMYRPATLEDRFLTWAAPARAARVLMVTVGATALVIAMLGIFGVHDWRVGEPAGQLQIVVQVVRECASLKSLGADYLQARRQNNKRGVLGRARSHLGGVTDSGRQWRALRANAPRHEDSAGARTAQTHLKCRAANAPPEPDLRYRSNSSARRSLANATTTMTFHGTQRLVCRQTPRLCSASRTRMFEVMPV